MLFWTFHAHVFREDVQVSCSTVWDHKHYRVAKLVYFSSLEEFPVGLYLNSSRVFLHFLAISALKNGGASTWRHLKTRDTILNSILSSIGSQWRSIFAFVRLVSYSFKFKIRFAAKFCTLWYFQISFWWQTTEEAVCVIKMWHYVTMYQNFTRLSVDIWVDSFNPK